MEPAKKHDKAGVSLLIELMQVKLVCLLPLPPSSATDSNQSVPLPSSYVSSYFGVLTRGDYTQFGV